MNLGNESETLEFKKTTAEIEKAMSNIASMLNKHGYGILYFGVLPNGEVIGQQVSANTLNDIAKKVLESIRPIIYPIVQEVVLDGKSVVKVEFSGKERPYSANGRYYKRVHDRTEEMTPYELRSEMSSFDVGSLWENHLTAYGLESIDSDTLRTFYKKATSCGRIQELPFYDEAALLSGLGLLEEGKLTNAGYYLFSNRRPVVLKTAVYFTDERISFSDINRFEGNIYNLLDKSFQYIKEHINWRVEQNDAVSRIEVPEIPIEAIREILVNSFAHADYRGITEHEIDITPTVVEIYNPGEFPSGLSPEMFATDHIKSMPRNRVILNTLYKSKDVEVFGSGFRKTYALCNASGSKCSYKSSHGGFSFFLQRRDVSKNVTDNVTIKHEKEKLSATDIAVLNSLKSDPAKTREQISKEVGKTVRTVQRSLGRLSDKGFLKRIGSKSNGYWEIILDPLDK